MNTQVPNHDDGPKLREELNYQEFYPTLDIEDILPIYNNNEILLSSDELRMHKDVNPDRPKIKQIIFNGKITTEPLVLDNKVSNFKQIAIPVEKLNLQLNHRNRPGPKRKYKGLSQQDIGDANAYLTKLDDTALIRKGTSSLYHHSNENQMDRDDERYNEIKEIERLNETLKKIVPNFESIRTYYDMDEQDALYVKYLSETYPNIKLTALQFEYIFTILELQFTILQSQIPTNPPPPATIDQLCSICDEVETTNNTIVFCDSCDIAVHQECYGIIFIPPGPWLCRACQQGNFVSARPHCSVCPQLGGALKQTTTGNWVHILCTVWIRELYFGNWHYLEPIEGLEKIPKSRWKLFCYICKQRVGACVQCSAKNCFVAYHVTCAKRLKCFMTPLKTGILAEMSLGNEHSLISYCHKHTPNVNHSMLKDTIISIRQEYLHNKELLSDKYLIRETIEVPQHFNNIICKSITAMTHSRNYALNRRVGDDICKYWSLKREHNKGAPLLDISSDIIKYPYNLIELTEIDDRLAYLDVFEQDLKKIENLVHLVDERSENQIKLFEAEERIHNIVFNTELYMLKDRILNIFVQDHAFKAIRRGIADDETKSMINQLLHYEFTDMVQFNQFFNNFFLHLENLPALPRAISSHFVKLKKLLNNLIAEVKSVNPKKLLLRDFKIDENDLSSIEEREWIGRILMEEEELSEVEELTPVEKRKLDDIIEESKNVSHEEGHSESDSGVDTNIKVASAPRRKRRKLAKTKTNRTIEQIPIVHEPPRQNLPYKGKKRGRKPKNFHALNQVEIRKPGRPKRLTNSTNSTSNKNRSAENSNTEVTVKIRKKPGPKPGTKIGKNGKPRKKPGPKPGTKIGLNGLPRKKPGPKPRLHKLDEEISKAKMLKKKAKLVDSSPRRRRGRKPKKLHTPSSKSARQLRARTK